MKRTLMMIAAWALAASVASAQVVTAPVVNNSAGQKIAAQPTIAVNEAGVYAGPGAANMTAGASVVSASNSTATPLGSGATFTGPWEDVLQYADVRVSVFSNVASAVDGLQLQYSSDGVNVDSFDPYTTTAGTGKLLSAATATRYFRIVYTNGGASQAAFRLQTIYRPQHPKSSSVRPSDGRSNEQDMEEYVSYQMVWDPVTATWKFMRDTRAPSTSVAATVTTANTFQTALAANANRRGCMIVNKSTATLLVSTDPSPTAAKSTILVAGTATTDGGIFNCANPGGLIVTDQISVTSSVATSAFLVISQ